MSERKRPNILLFVTDQQQERITRSDYPSILPRLERFANEGVRFGQMFTTMAHCCPSRASLFTGLYPSQHGVYNNVSNPQALSVGLRHDVATFAERLSENGYSLYFSGKWHISSTENPQDRGWTELNVTAGKDSFMSTTVEQWRKVHPTLGNNPRSRGALLRPGWRPYQLYGESDRHYLSDNEVVKAAERKIRELRDAQEPWCMYVGVLAPHDPFFALKEYIEAYDPKQMPLPYNYRDQLLDKPAYFRRMRNLFDQLSESEVRECIAHYLALNSQVDDMFGRVLDALESTGQADDTLVIFMSDHGESLGAHGLFLKGISPYDETYRIPCIMRWPNGINQSGRVVDELTSIMDIAPTIIEVAQAETRSPMSGQSLAPFFHSAHVPTWRDTVYSQCNGVEIYFTQRIVRTKQFKLVYNPTDVDELYDLESDPYEMANLSDNPKFTDIKYELFRRLWQNAAQVNDTLFGDYPTVAMAPYGPALALQ